MSRCLACNCTLSSRELTRKYRGWEHIKNPEDRYIGLCGKCLNESGIHSYDENTTLSNNDSPSNDTSEYIIDEFEED